MFRKIIFFIFAGLIPTLSSSGQQIDTRQFLPAGDSLRGNLLFVSETHDVKTNLPEYYDLIKSISSPFNASDTLTVFLEAPYTLTYFINKYVRGEGTVLADSIFRNDPDKIEYYFALRKLHKNIRFIGVDFEYDHGNAGARLESYKAYFDDLKKELERNKIDLSVIRSFIYGIRIQGLDDADIYTFRKYIQKLRINQTDLVLKSKLTEANFILNSRVEWEKEDTRDKFCFARFNELLLGGLTINSNYNVLIYGSAHSSPYNDRSMYSLLNYDKNSPFNSKVYFLANVYYGCLSVGSYDDRHFTLETNGPYFYSEEDLEFLELIRKNYEMPQENSMVIYRNTLSSDLKDFNRIKYIAIHNKVK